MSDAPTYPEITDRELHRVAPTAIIYKDNRYLITRRSLKKKVYAGKWSVPGGGLSVDDYINEPSSTPGAKQWYNSLHSCLRREIKEETGLEVGEFKYLTDMTFIRPDNVPVITFSFYTPWKSGDVTLSEEDTEFAWVTVEESKKYDLIDGIAEEIADVHKILHS